MASMKLTDDEELREKIRLKCLNDWEIELTEDQATMGLIEQEEQKLSIFHNQLWPNKRSYKDKSDGGKWKTRVTWDKTIDGYRAIALRNGFAGIDPTRFVEINGELIMATVTVYKIQSDGKRYPFIGEARFDEFAPRNKEGEINLTGQWKTAPYNQLSIAAQRQALRLAFQECNDGQSELLVAPDTAAEVPEPMIEPSRGDEAPVDDDDDDGDEVEAPKSNPFVGIPRDGFKFGQMYNEKERIVLKSKKEDGSFTLALDSGFTVVVNRKGYEISRRERSDDNQGGRPWKEGAKFYDGEIVEKVAEVKKDPKGIWLALDNGLKVRLDQWGKVIKQKERKVAEPEEEKEQPEPEPEPEKEAGLLPIGKFRKLSSREEMRSSLIPALAQWCREVNKGKKISPKQAYTEFTGVEISGGKSMGMEDYPVLYECLLEALDAHRNGEEYSNEPERSIA
jgi:hypothetical protein